MTGVKFGDASRLPALVITSATEGLVTYDAVAKTYHHQYHRRRRLCSHLHVDRPSWQRHCL
ncbi:MAG: hypothetical protein MZU97_04760 [Bacillus subtilis]|nr:hypothetical protein [Bacillus subtilis]